MWSKARVIVALLLAALTTVPTEASGQGLDFFWAIVEQLGHRLKSVGSLGEGGTDEGQVWMVELGTGERRALTQESDFSWPVLGRDEVTVYALRLGQLVRLDPGAGDPIPLGPSGGIEKLVGVAADGTILAILREGRPGRPALIAPDGSVTALPLPETPDEKRNIAILLSENRAFSGDRRLVVDRAENVPDPRRRGFDVYLVSDGVRRNLSQCGSDSCGQPSMSPAGDRVLYIRAKGS